MATVSVNSGNKNCKSLLGMGTILEGKFEVGEVATKFGEIHATFRGPDKTYVAVFMKPEEARDLLKKLREELNR